MDRLANQEHCKAVQILGQCLVDSEYNDIKYDNIVSILNHVLGSGKLSQPGTLQNKVSKTIIPVLTENLNLLSDIVLADTDTVVDFGYSILNLVQSKCNITDTMLVQVQNVLKSLSVEEQKIQIFFEDAWNTLLENLLLNVDLFNTFVVKSPCQLEKTVFSWVKQAVENDISVFQFENSFLVLTKLASQSEVVFKAITSLLYNFLTLLNGHHKVIVLTSYYVDCVSKKCRSFNNSFFSLYPSEICRLVTLLAIPPNFLPSSNQPYFGSDEFIVTKTLVCKEINNALQSDTKRTLMLLTHFSQWLSHYVMFVDAL